ncbi:L-aspartate oxidase [Halobacillus shinanisalinarum]|uniref:L-aspartate oxidase n=1 Tax=Halobacillus shinanisalinarum TaxID=2932258 RepID=A0ABY4H2I2_9BACI|nr:L-aspartate oxidase [Halobacillus shinanisalinarum]UOQ94501.1 L-aspartate oxidase [Halobacillus shinanisalinarum]
MRRADVIIVGSGIAALQIAVHLPRHLHVIVLTKSQTKKSNSSLAQGGIAAAIGDWDQPSVHYKDTMEAGRNVNNQMAVHRLTEEGPAIIRELVNVQCQFDRDENGNLQLGKEGAHSHSRIIHGGGDQTGRRIVDCLVGKLGPNVDIYENECVYELHIEDDGRCYGIKSKTSNGASHSLLAPYVILSTGGCGQLYSFTSNAEEVTGDGIALAYWAGARVRDMEFVQFHPTLLFCNGEGKGLVSEAVRGEGARLVDDAGNYLMDGVHPMGDLAPRHIVAQAIFSSIQNGRSVYLDIASISDFEKRFPTAAKLCQRNGVSGSIPVAPGCHFLMGGIEVDDRGRTNVPGLYAVGEAACTGVHGANRLASNSLLEGLVYGKRLAKHITEQAPAPFIDEPPNCHYYEDLSGLNLPTIEEIQCNMMDRAGIVREEKSLLAQLKWIESFELEKWVRTDFSQLTKQQWSILAMLQTSWLIINAALKRTESRGGHFRSDFPYESDEWQRKHTTEIRYSEKRRSYESVQA